MRPILFRESSMIFHSQEGSDGTEVRFDRLSVDLKSRNLLKNSGSTRYLEPIKPSHSGDGYPFKKRICPGDSE